MTPQEVIKEILIHIDSLEIDEAIDAVCFHSGGDAGYVKALNDMRAFIEKRFCDATEKVEPTIKGWVARDSAGRLGLYDQMPTKKIELGAFMGVVENWVIGDDWIGRFSLDYTAKDPFQNLHCEDGPIEVGLTIHRV